MVVADVSSPHGYEGIAAVVRVSVVEAGFQTACGNGFTGATLLIVVTISYWVRCLR